MSDVQTCLMALQDYGVCATDLTGLFRCLDMDGKADVEPRGRGIVYTHLRILATVGGWKRRRQAEPPRCSRKGTHIQRRHGRQWSGLVSKHSYGIVTKIQRDLAAYFRSDHCLDRQTASLEKTMNVGDRKLRANQPCYCSHVQILESFVARTERGVFDTRMIRASHQVHERKIR